MNEVIAMIGIATKAGLTVSGEFMSERAIKDKRACLIIVSENASDNTKKKFRDKCSYYKTPFCIYGRKDELGSALGKDERAVIAILDLKLSVKISDLLEKHETEVVKWQK